MEILDLASSRRAEMFALLRVCLGERETVRRDERFWNWKHERSPFGVSTVLLGDEDGRLVGLRAFLRWRWEAGGQAYSAVRAVDTVTHPQFQRRGIFNRLTLAGLEVARSDEVAFVFNTPNKNSLPGYLKMGWRRVGRIPMQLRVLRPLRFAAGLSGAKLALQSALERNPASLPPNEACWLSAPMPAAVFLEQAEGLETLIERDAALRGSGLTTSRSCAFFRWRYAEHPYVSYYVESLEQEGRLKGVLIWRTNARFGLREVALCDLLLAERDSAVVAALVAGVRNRLRADYLIAHFGAGSSHRELLRGCGFFTFPGQGMEFTVRTLRGGMTLDPLKLDNWSLCLGDLEIF